MKKITITGGGLTGLSLAIALRQHGIPVLLHEAGSYPRHRVCGEFISGISPSTLDTLGIADTLADAQHHQTITWFSGDKQTRTHTLTQPALALSRHLLDARLHTTALHLGAEILTHSRTPPTPFSEGHIWCAGRKPTPGKWIGLKAHIRGIPSSSDLEMHTGPNGYLGATSVENGWKNLCGLFKIDRSITARHHLLLPAYLRKNGNHRLATSLHTAQWRPDSFTAVAGFSLGHQRPTPGLLCLGDSHSIIPPFTGNGMTMAFQSAETALPHLLTYSLRETSWETACAEIEAALHTRFRTRLTAAGILHPLLFHPLARPLVKLAPLTSILRLVR